MYVEIDFNLLYQVEKIAQRDGRSVTEIINEAVAQYLEHQPAADDSAATQPDDPA
jgi:predicted transcriptional regulator